MNKSHWSLKHSKNKRYCGKNKGETYINAIEGKVGLATHSTPDIWHGYLAGHSHQVTPQDVRMEQAQSTGTLVSHYVHFG
jgi:hypothetical protein